jgi:HEAT repeat protein
MTENDSNNVNGEKKKSLIRVTVHSFFVVPFLIAVFSILLYGLIRILTVEEHTVYDYLNDIKIGSHTKRWQAAFELSKILANPDIVPKESRFVAEMTRAFEHAQHDDDRVRQYLALAMGRTGFAEFVDPLLQALPDEKEANLPALLHALGLLRDKRAVEQLHAVMDHSNAKIRLAAVIALGHLNDNASSDYLRKALYDNEPNVQWDAAIALAKLGDASGKDVLRKLMDRNYLQNFIEVDQYEQDQALIVAIEASSLLNDSSLNIVIHELSENDRNMNVRRAALKALER